MNTKNNNYPILPPEASLPAYLFHQGTNFYAYDFLGVHKTCDAETNRYSYTFRVWAPNAVKAGVTGDFTNWNETIPMEKITEGGLISSTLSGANQL